MDYRLIVNRTWRYRDRRHGVKVFPAGEYSVPEQLSLDAANLAVDQGMATIYRVQMPSAETPAAPEIEHPAAPRSKRGPKRRKGPAPENKIVHAEDNKQRMV